MCCFFRCAYESLFFIFFFSFHFSQYVPAFIITDLTCSLGISHKITMHGNQTLDELWKKKTKTEMKKKTFHCLAYKFIHRLQHNGKTTKWFWNIVNVPLNDLWLDVKFSLFDLSLPLNPAMAVSDCYCWYILIWVCVCVCLCAEYKMGPKTLKTVTIQNDPQRMALAMRMTFGKLWSLAVVRAI